MFIYCFWWVKNNSEKVQIEDYTDDDMIGLTKVATSDPKFWTGVTILKDETLNIFYKKSL